MGPPNHDDSPGRGRNPGRHGRAGGRYDDANTGSPGGQSRDSPHMRHHRPRSPPVTLKRSRSRSRSCTPDRRRRRSPSRSPPHRRRRSYSTSRSRSASPAYRRRRSYSRSPGRSLSPSADRNKRKGRKHKRKRSRSRSVSSSDAGSDGKHHTKKKRRAREEKERRKKEKKDKKKKKHATGSSSSHWGKYGVITEADFYSKTQEFRTWLLEERKLNPESLSKDQERKEFQVFMEDYNTATLPHEKYYHIEAYERRMSALRSGEFVPPADDAYDPAADMKAHSSRHKKSAAEQDSYLSREQLMELRRVQHERIEIGRMKRLGMDVKQNMGVRMDGSMFDG